MHEKRYWYNSQIDLYLFLQKYNHFQPPDAAGFSMVNVILNSIKYFSTKITYTSLEVYH